MLAYFLSMHNITSKYRIPTAEGGGSITAIQLQPRSRNAIPSMDRTPSRAFIDPHDLTDANPMRIFSTTTAPTRFYFPKHLFITTRSTNSCVGQLDKIYCI